MKQFEQPSSIHKGSPFTSFTNINKLLTIQNAALRTVTGCTQEQTHSTYPTKQKYYNPKNTKLHTIQTNNTTPITPTLQTNNTLTHSQTQETINTRYTTIISTYPGTITERDINTNLTIIHTIIVIKHIAKRYNVKYYTPPPINTTEETPLAQLRINKSPFLK